MVVKKNILITGSNGQLGKSLRLISNDFPQYKFFFKTKKDLNITDFESINSFVTNEDISCIINCAAYTDVNNCKPHSKTPDLVNNISVGNLSKICSTNNISLVHFSTDYVFDGRKLIPYTENDLPNPINYYGLTKLNGEKFLLKWNLRNSIIIRTSWLYSKSDNNFVNKIIEKIRLKKPFYVTTNEIGSPTFADDLARAVLTILPGLKNIKTDLFHFAGDGYCSRYDFAKKISNLIGEESIILPKSTKTMTVRPKFSPLCSKKFCKFFNYSILPWEDTLKNFLLNQHEKSI